MLLCCLAAYGHPALSQMPLQEDSAPVGRLEVTVTDPSGQPLNAVAVSVEQKGKVISRKRAAPSGHLIIERLPAGAYEVVIERQGFYTASIDNVGVAAGTTLPVEVRLQPVREYRENIEVTAQSSPINPEQISNTHSLTSDDISTIPYPTTRDYRNVLPYIPGVIADRGGQIHVAGSSTQQIQDYMDGFEVAQPASGALGVRV